MNPPPMLPVTALAGTVRGFSNGEGVPSSWLVVSLPRAYAIREGLADHFAHYPTNDPRMIGSVT